MAVKKGKTENNSNYHNLVKAAFKGNDIEEITRQICIAKNELNWFDHLQMRVLSIDPAKDIQEQLTQAFDEANNRPVAWNTLRDALLAMCFREREHRKDELTEWITALRENRVPDYIPEPM